MSWFSWLRDKDNRESAELVFKVVTAGTLGVYTLILGTGYLGYLDGELSMKSKLVGDTTMPPPVHGPYYTSQDLAKADPAKGVPAEWSRCEVSGSYVLTNVGEYPFEVESVTFELWRFPYLDVSEAAGVVSYSMSERMSPGAKHPAEHVGKPLLLPVVERIGKSNQIQRSFGFIVPISVAEKALHETGNGPRYIVVANAKARLEHSTSWISRLLRWAYGDSSVEFHTNDLRHMTATFNICDSQPSPPHE